MTTAAPPQLTVPGPAILARSRPDPGAQAGAARLARTVETVLARHGADASVARTVVGPTITRVDLALAPSTRVAQVTRLARDIAVAAVVPSVRLVEQGDGPWLGVELPSAVRQVVRLGDVLAEPTGALSVALGADVAGAPVGCDLASLPHLLVGGTTGGGKTTLLHSLVTSLLASHSPDEVRLLLVDPKRTEFMRYGGLPHLLAPPVTDATMALGALELMVEEVETRYARLGRARLPDIAAARAAGMPWPRIVVVVDEIADLVMAGGKLLERVVLRLAQKARAVGIHLVLATQSPRVSIVSGNLKANLPARAGLTVASGTDSRVILDQVGAERLLGRGDMLWSDGASMGMRRVQCAYTDAADLGALRAWWAAR